MVMTYSHAKVQGQRSAGSEDQAETDGQTIALPHMLTQSVKSNSCHCYWISDWPGKVDSQGEFRPRQSAQDHYQRSTRPMVNTWLHWLWSSSSHFLTSPCLANTIQTGLHKRQKYCTLKTFNNHWYIKLKVFKFSILYFWNIKLPKLCVVLKKNVWSCCLAQVHFISETCCAMERFPTKNPTISLFMSTNKLY